MATICLSLLLVLAVGSSIFGIELTVLTVCGGVGAALVTTVLASTTPVVRGIGAVLAPPVAVLLAVPVTFGAALVTTGTAPSIIVGLSLWSIVITSFAATLVPWREIGAGGVRRGATGSLLVALGIGVALLGTIGTETDARRRVRAATVDGFGSLVDFIVFDEPWGIVALAAVLVLTSLLVWGVVGYLRWERLVPPDRHEAVSRTVNRVSRTCSIGIRLGIALMILAVGTPLLSERFDDVPIAPGALRSELPTPVGEVLAVTLSSSVLRATLLVIGTVAFLLGFVEWVRRALRGNGGRIIAVVVSPAAGGVFVSVLVVTVVTTRNGIVSVENVIDSTPIPVGSLLAVFPPTATALFALLLAVGLLSSLLFSVTAARAIRILPATATSTALASIALFTFAAALAAFGAVERALVTGAGAFVVWDIGEHANRLERELGRAAHTARAEFVHISGSLLTGTAVAVGAVVLYRSVGIWPLLVDQSLAALLVGLGVVILVVVSLSVRT